MKLTQSENYKKQQVIALMNFIKKCDNMTDLNFNTKKAQNYIRAYKNARYSSLRQCYKTRPSEVKERAETLIRREMEAVDGHNFKIISFSHFFFTCGYTTGDGNIVIETPSHSYYIKMPF